MITKFNHQAAIMKKITFSIFFVAIAAGADSQTIVPKVLNTTGNSSSSGSIVLEWSVGEAIIGTLANGNIVTQGLLQPLELLNAPLPVKWIYFKANLVNNSTLLEWETSQEINNDRFEIERSSDGTHFSFLKKINGNGNSSLPRKYTAMDHSPYNDVTHYRLKQVDINGSSSYSAIVSVKKRMNNNYRFFPNPVLDVLFVERGDGNHTSIIEIYDAPGRLIKSYLLNQDEVKTSLNLRFLSKGSYFMKIIEGDNQWVQQFLKQ